MPEGPLKRYLWHAVLFVVVLGALCSGIDYLVTAGLRKSGSEQYVVWNDIRSGSAASDVIIQGSSRAWVHFSPGIIGDRLGMTCYNLGVDGYDLDMQLARYRLYREHNQKPKVVVQALDVSSLNVRSDIYEAGQFLPYFNEDAVREGVRPYDYFKWYDYYLPLVRYREEFGLAYAGAMEALGLRHYTSAKDRGYEGMDMVWTGEFEQYARDHPDGVEVVHLEAAENDLDAFLAECNREGILVVLVYPPEYYKGQELVNNREEIFAIYRRLAGKHGVEFLDYSSDPMSLDTTYFYNSQHMNKAGAELFSADVAEKLAQIVDAPTTPAARAAQAAQAAQGGLELHVDALLPAELPEEQQNHADHQVDGPAD